MTTDIKSLLAAATPVPSIGCSGRGTAVSKRKCTCGYDALARAFGVE